MKLYELLEQYEELQNNLMSEDEEVVANAYEQLEVAEAQIEEKSEAYAKVIRNISAEAEAYKAESQRLAKKARTCANAVERLKEALKNAMIVTGKTKVPTSIGTFRIQANPYSCKVIDISQIPTEFIENEPKVLNSSIIAYFKETGEIVPGVDITREQGIRFQ